MNYPWPPEPCHPCTPENHPSAHPELLKLDGYWHTAGWDSRSERWYAKCCQGHILIGSATPAQVGSGT